MSKVTKKIKILLENPIMVFYIYFKTATFAINTRCEVSMYSVQYGFFVILHTICTIMNRFFYIIAVVFMVAENKVSSRLFSRKIIRFFFFPFFFFSRMLFRLSELFSKGNIFCLKRLNFILKFRVLISDCDSAIVHRDKAISEAINLAFELFNFTTFRDARNKLFKAIKCIKKMSYFEYCHYKTLIEKILKSYNYNKILLRFKVEKLHQPSTINGLKEKNNEKHI